MQFHPRLTKKQSALLVRMKKLLKSEWSETVKINGKKVKAVEIEEFEIKVQGELVQYVTEDAVYDFDGKSYPLTEIFENQIEIIESFLGTFIFEDELQKFYIK
jgi:cytoplasmic iron level regulating protein YaaA (DUF328/UPF0246 family)